MFSRGLKVKDKGIDITFRNNPDHVLSPDNPEILLQSRFGKLKAGALKKYYLELLVSRFKNRKSEFISLAKDGMNEEIKLLCYCGKKESECHAQYAAYFMNALIKKIKKF
jgi:hypothetical protein